MILLPIAGAPCWFCRPIDTATCSSLHKKVHKTSPPFFFLLYQATFSPPPHAVQAYSLEPLLPTLGKCPSEWHPSPARRCHSRPFGRREGRSLLTCWSHCRGTSASYWRAILAGFSTMSYRRDRRFVCAFFVLFPPLPFFFVLDYRYILNG